MSAVERVDDEAARATDELLTLLLDDLGPTLQRYRDEVARRLGLSPAELLCLDLCRRHGTMTSNRIGQQLGLTRSAVWKLLHRLEKAGHIDRRAPQGREQEVEVRLRPHARRDAVLADLRATLRRRVTDLVVDHDLRDRRHAAVAIALVGMANRLFSQAQTLADAAANERLLAARRRARAADTSTPWWAR